MPWTSVHLGWLKQFNLGSAIACGRPVEFWEFAHQQDPLILSALSKHIRNHYCLDTEIDLFRGFKSRKDYLNDEKLPTKQGFGPPVRAGDFGEIFVSDYVQYALGFHVPRTRYSRKNIRNESPKGCDVIGFKFHADGATSRNDSLIIFEVKVQFSGTSPKPRLQEAIKDSVNDPLKKGESLNAIKQRLYDVDAVRDAENIKRFQNPVDDPYTNIYGAAAMFSSGSFDLQEVLKTNSASHPNSANLILLVFVGNDLMSFVHSLYDRVANEA
jgi:hypothetical protein